ncbi:histone deacetylase HDT1-like [Aristolochia californica]|uniref:histone deacetylase HDT1-like n=1 Tax=Aristolochia californica TaxID=171875 RepID=UPI0035DAB069
MEFWGIEVKPGENVKCDPGFDSYLHLSQAALDEVKKDKGAEVVMSVKLDGPKMVIGTLAREKFPQVSFDLVFEKEFELSHNGKSSVYFCGYKTLRPDYEGEDFSDSDEDSEDDQIAAVALNGMPDTKVAASKPVVKANAAKSDSKPKAKAEPVKAEKAKEDKDEDDEDDDEFEEDESGSDEDMAESGDESDEDDEEDISEDEKEATPKKVETGKKRANESAAKKTPGSDKKAKLATPTGGDGKKGGGHTATPHPNKAGAKTLANGDKSKQQTPKSGGQVSCKSCSKTFNSDGALQSHTKAKHSASK